MAASPKLLAKGALCLGLLQAGAAEPFLTKNILFTAGSNDYALYRIPGIVVTARGTVLVYCEARRSDSGDWGTIDLLLRRSEDRGQTWSKQAQLPRPRWPVPVNPVALAQKLKQSESVTFNNPTAIADRQGAVHFLFCAEYARCFYSRSEDDGRSFSEPADITSAFEAFRPEYDWKVLAVGPGHGIQLKNGRLLVPVWLSTGTGGHAHRPSCVSTLYSDDAGRTWHRGEVVVNHPTLKNPSESTVAQLADGRVVLNLRHEGHEGLRAVCFSPDGATGWTRPRFDPLLPEPVCFGSLARLSETPHRDRLLFVNPHNPARARNNWGAGERRNLTVKLSYDGGNTWPAQKSLEPGLSGYADVAADASGRIYCFYEQGGQGGNAFKTRALCLATFSLEWLTNGADHF